MAKTLVKKQDKTDVKYNAGGATSLVADKEKAVRFVAIVSNLKVHYYVTETTPLGTVNEARAIQFKFQFFETDNQELIEALRDNAAFGGSAKNKFADASKVGEHFFYEGAYPESVNEKLKKEKGMLQDQEGVYEEKAPEDRFTSREIL